MRDRELRDRELRDRDPLLDLRDDPVLHSVVTSLRELPSSDPAAVQRIAQAAMKAGPARMPSVWRGALSRPWHLAGAALAASALVAVGYMAGHAPRVAQHAADTRASNSWGIVAQPVSDGAERHATLSAFRLDAPAARAVSVVGDFNSWDPKVTPMTRGADGRTWAVDLPIQAGRHTYAFVVDGIVIADPDVPSVRDPDYDVPVSALIVRER
jgi:hypothetical protein